MFFRNKCSHTELKLEADFTDPIWCAICNWNFDIEDLSISTELVEQLIYWTQEFIDIQNFNGPVVDLEDRKLLFNNYGEELKKKLEIELRKPILFIPMN